MRRLNSACLFCFSAVLWAGVGIGDITIHGPASHNERFYFSPKGTGPGATVTLTWTTTEPATSQVVYGQGEEKQTLLTPFDSVLKTQHVVRLQSRLQSGLTYRFQVQSRTADGTLFTSEPANFTTPTSSAWWKTAHDRYYKKTDWDAQTTWVGGGRAYRLNLNLEQAVTNAWVGISRYERWEGGARLYVNGQFVGFWSRGFSMGTFNIGQYLTTGDNVIAIDADDESILLLVEGELELADTSVQVIQTRANLWRTHPDPPMGWEQPDFIDTGWKLATGDRPPVGETAPYTAMSVELPGDTTRRLVEKGYTAALVRRNQILDGGLRHYREQRNRIGITNTDRELADNLVALIHTYLYDSAPILDAALAALDGNDPATAEDLLGDVGVLLGAAETNIQVIEFLTQLSAGIINLQEQNNLVGPFEDVDARISVAQGALMFARTDISVDNPVSATVNLITGLGSIDAGTTELQCACDCAASTLNHSDDGPFGWLRIRGRFAPLIYGPTLDRTNNRVDLGEDGTFADIPVNLTADRADSLGFLTPFTPLNLTEVQYDVAPGVTHVAYATAMGVRIRALADGVLYNRAKDGDWTANWLLIWDAGSTNQVYQLAFAANPDGLAAFDGRIRITRAAGIGDLVIYRPYADGRSINGDTTAIKTWAAGLPTAVQTDIDTWSRILTQVPYSYVEVYAEDVKTSEGVITTRYRYLDLEDEWGTTPLTIAPVPNPLSFARSNKRGGLTLIGSPVDSGVQAGSWGPFEFLQGTDTLQYRYNLPAGDLLNGINDPLGRNPFSQEEVAASGFNALRHHNLVLTEEGPTPGFSLREGWEQIITDNLTTVNGKGLTAVMMVWTMVGQAGGLEDSPEKQAAFVDAWGSIASIAKDFNVVYDLINEPEFDSVENYNPLMQQAAQAIRAQDPVNPIAINGFDDFAKDFTGLTHPGVANVWYEFHAYERTGGQTYSGIERYYPGHMAQWFENEYHDQDMMIEDGWLSALRAWLADERVELYFGEFGVQAEPEGVGQALMRDTVTLARRFRMHLSYFVSRGWTNFDLYGGKDDTFYERTELTGILKSLNDPRLGEGCLEGVVDVSAWLDGKAQFCAVTAPTILTYAAYVSNSFTCPTP